MKLAVYCGSAFGTDAAYSADAHSLGRWMGAQGHSLVYGGGNEGLMGIVAREVYEAGGTVIGVVPENVAFIRNRPQPYVTQLVTTASMGKRKEAMFTMADGYIALPGGAGTLDEIAEVITLIKIGIADKKCVLWNTNGFYDPLRQLFDNMEQGGFLTADSMQHVLFSADLEEVAAFLEK